MKNDKKPIATESAPPPAGPYSQAVALGPLLFLSGQTPRDRFGVRHLDAPVDEQVEMVMSNLEEVANAAGSSLKHALKVTGYLRPDIDVETFNRVYAQYLGPIPPARTLIVSDLKTGAVEVDAILLIP